MTFFVLKELFMEKFRKYLGDLTSLRESIKKHGLIHPIIYDSNGTLIAGRRRKKACEELGIIPKHIIIDFDDPESAQIDENVERKDFTVNEIYEINVYLNDKLSRQGERTDKQLLSESDRSKNEHPRETVAKITGYSTDTLSKINQIYEKATPDIIEKIDNKEMSVNEAYKEIKKQEKKKDRETYIKKLKEENNTKTPDGLFDVIVIDPPWSYGREYNPDSSRVANPYPEISQEELLQIEPPFSENAICFLWTTHAFIFDAKELLNQWGLAYKAILVWDKEKMGIGHWFRMQCEFCLVGIKGNPFWDNTTWRDIIREPRRQHSRKPEIFYKMIDDITVGKKLDYFSRQKRAGWESFGNEKTRF